MTALAEKQCVPCKGGVPPLKGDDLVRLAGELDGGWQVVAEHQLEKEYQFRDFREALAFTNKVGALAEAQGHHPDIYLAWGKVKLTVWTHKINGLTESDFVLAAKADKLLTQYRNQTFPNWGFLAKANSSTTFPLIRCSWMIRSRTSGVQE